MDDFGWSRYVAFRVWVSIGDPLPRVLLLLLGRQGYSGFLSNMRGFQISVISAEDWDMLKMTVMNPKGGPGGLRGEGAIW